MTRRDNFLQKLKCFSCGATDRGLFTRGGGYAICARCLVKVDKSERADLEKFLALKTTQHSPEDGGSAA